MKNENNYSKISLIHKTNNENYAWWNDCVIYELPFPTSKNELQLFTSTCHNLVQLGIDTILVRPSKLDFTEEKSLSRFYYCFPPCWYKSNFQLSGPCANMNLR